MINNLANIIVPSVATFVVGIFMTPILTSWLYKKKMWKKESVKKSIDGNVALVTQKIHNDEARKTPRMGGIVVWGSVFVVSFLIYLISILTEGSIFERLSFISRSQTWIPFATLIIGGIVGFFDDFFVCQEKGSYVGGGFSLKKRLMFVSTTALLIGVWFYSKLDMTSIHIPFNGELVLGSAMILFVFIVILALYSGGIIDGVDGLAGGIFSIMFSAYAIIAFAESQYDLSALCMAIVGGLLAFLWYNAPPARFFMSETGTMALTITLGVVAFLSGHVVEILLIALPLVITTLSVIIQLVSKKYRGKKVFLVAPLHNHFQALGWSGPKVTIRYFIVGVISAFSGVVVALVG
jgi:phospho-N-acetylmuramoyl-pentapeptide-transferase